MHSSLAHTASVALVFALAGCGRPSATSVCGSLERAGVAKNCAPKQTGGIGAAAKEGVDFDLSNVAGEKGQVLGFDSDESYDKTVANFDNFAHLAGPHRYGSRKARIFVQMNAKTPDDDAKKAKDIVDGL